MKTVFISDLHLSSDRPDISELFLHFLKNRLDDVKALYILGDLFEAWLGDDAVDPGFEPIIQAIYNISKQGVRLYFIHGNRDFLLGDQSAKRMHCHLLSEPSMINIAGKDTLIMHGDSLCTDDQQYQLFREKVRQPQWQDYFLALSIEQRLEMVKQAREKSDYFKSTKSMEIMDVNQHAVEQLMTEHKVTQLIHGHTHRPNIHHFTLDGVAASRIVLGDWYDQGSMLICDDNECKLESFR